MKWHPDRPLLEILTGHWIGMTGTALVTLAGISWLFLLPMHLAGRANNAYIGLLAFVALPLVFFTGLALIPIGAALARRRIARTLPAAPDRRSVWRRAAIFFGVMTAANLVIGSQLTYRAVAHMETAQFCGQTCHVMKPEFTAHLQPPHAAVECAACHVTPGAEGFFKSKMAGTRQLLLVALNSYPRPIESAMESNRLAPSADTCEQCHQRGKAMTPRLRTIWKFGADEANTATATVLLVMVDKIHAAHLAPGVSIRYAAADKKRQTLPWVEYSDATGARREYSSGDKPDGQAALPRFAMQCVDCHNRAAHSFETPDRALDGAIAAGQIPADLPFVKKQGLALLQASYSSEEDARARIGSSLAGFYRAGYPDVAARRAKEILSAGETLAAIYARNVFPDLKVTWGTYPDNLGHADYPGCFRCHDGNHVTKSNEAITQDCAACHNAIAVEESSPEILKSLGLARK